MTSLTVTINGRAYGPREVRDDLTMNDFLREYLGLTGTKFGCGAAQCLSCAVIIDNPDGKSYTGSTCVVSAASFNGKAIRTIEGHAKNGELSVLQRAFIEHFAFQCGYCTAGFLNESQVLLERLAKKPVARADLEKTIAEALVPQVVLGQAQGGFAMGVGYALLESLPPFEGGPGNGQWNLGQYLVARGSDLPLHDLEIEVLPALANEAPKGMAEVVMIPVVPALLNAIFDATGRRFRALPVTQRMLKGAIS